MEQGWRMRLQLPGRPRGGSSGGTADALRNTVRLATGGDDAPILGDLKWITRWCHQAKIALGEEEHAKRLPREYGSAGSKCPWCGHDTLRQLANAGIVFCVDPTCTDDEGRRPRAFLEFFDGEWVLRWQDQVIGMPA